MRRAQIHVALLMLLLLGYFDFALWNLPALGVSSGLLGPLLALFATAATLLKRRWVKYPVAGIAFMLALEWSASVYLSARIGYFAHQGLRADLAALCPGIAMLLLAAYGCYVAWVHVGIEPRAPQASFGNTGSR